MKALKYEEGDLVLGNAIDVTALVQKLPERDRPYVYFIQVDPFSVGYARDVRSGKQVKIPENIRDNYEALVAYLMVTLL
jgi:hypothetical protein